MLYKKNKKKYLPKFSVILPVFWGTNSNEFMCAYQSLIRQTIPPDEIIIICDGKLKVNLKVIIAKLERDNKLVKVYKSKYNFGPGHARNFGVEKSKYNIVAFMDSDDISLPKRFELQLPFFRKKDISAVGGFIKEINLNSNISKVRIVMEVPSNELRNKFISPVNNVTMIVKKKEFLVMGGFPEIRKGEDFVLWAKFILNKKKIINLAKILVEVKVSELEKKRIKSKIDLQYITYLGRIKWFNIYEEQTLKFILLVLFFSPLIVTQIIYKILRRFPLENQIVGQRRKFR